MDRSLSFEQFETDECKFSAIDKAAAERYGRTFPEKCLFAYLMASARMGHLHVEISNDTVFPIPEELFGPLKDLDRFLSFIRQGSQNLSEGHPIAREGNRFALKRIAEARLEILNAISSIESQALPACISLSEDRQMTEEQKRAVETALNSPFFILTGGPGTGKTFTAAKIVEAVIRSSANSLKIALAAPTGKAALHLEKTLNASLGLSIQGATLHRLTYGKESALPYDLFLIDEASMIDLMLMRDFMKKVKRGARIILLGDPDQLPPVECGSLFPELCASHPSVVRLTRCLRAERHDLAACAQGLLQGLSFKESESVKIHFEISSIDQFLNQFQFPEDAALAEEVLLKSFDTFRILTPLRRGPFGVEAINRFFLRRYAEKMNGELFPYPIMITANDSSLKLFNGEAGVLLTRHSPFEPLSIEDRALFSDGRSFPALLLPSFEYAFAITVHKSQGSEFDRVALILGKDPLSTKKQLLYTAATRAKKELIVCYQN